MAPLLCAQEASVRRSPHVQSLTTIPVPACKPTAVSDAAWPTAWSWTLTGNQAPRCPSYESHPFLFSSWWPAPNFFHFSSPHLLATEFIGASTSWCEWPHRYKCQVAVCLLGTASRAKGSPTNSHANTVLFSAHHSLHLLLMPEVSLLTATCNEVKGPSMKWLETGH